MSKIKPCFWFATQAEEAANFYVSLLPNSHIRHVQRNTMDSPGGKSGSVLLVEFTLAGQDFMALNGNSAAPQSNAVSFMIDCTDQAEVDRLWDALLADGGKPQQCGWLTDRFGVPWQIVPSELPRIFAGPDKEGGKRAMKAMMGMVKLDIDAIKKAYAG